MFQKEILIGVSSVAPHNRTELSIHCFLDPSLPTYRSTRVSGALDPMNMSYDHSRPKLHPHQPLRNTLRDTDTAVCPIQAAHT
jgi:hypothetical protein